MDELNVIRYRCTRLVNDEKTICERFYISSFDTTPEQFGYLIRNHWSIENRLHWMLDVLFHEDASTVGTYCFMRMLPQSVKATRR